MWSVMLSLRRLLSSCALALFVLQGSAAQGFSANHNSHSNQQHVNCPAEPDLAYISCENMHSAYDGLNIFRQKFLRFLDAAYCQNRVAVMPKFRTVVGAEDFIEWTNVFDIHHFSHHLLTHHGMHAVLSDCVPPNLEAAPDNWDCALAKNNTHAIMQPPVSVEYL
jgi:hypothetical protein